MDKVDKTLEEKYYREKLETFQMTVYMKPFRIPEHMHDGIVLYLVHKIPPGGFLTAVLENDLFGACSKADHINIGLLYVYCTFFYTVCPPGCYGSPEKVKAWLEERG